MSDSQIDRNRDVNCKIFAQLGQEIKKAQGLKTADFDLSSFELGERSSLIPF